MSENVNKANTDNYLDLLGKHAKDKVTKFEGVLSSVSFDLYGCVQVAITPPIDKDGKLVDGRWLDVHRVEIDDSIPRVMPVPAFSGTVEFSKIPAEHKHGPAEKPSQSI